MSFSKFKYLISFCLIFGSLVALKQAQAQVSWDDAVRNQLDLVTHLRKDYPRTSFLVEARGSCTSGEPGFIQLPPISWNQQVQRVGTISRLNKSLENNSALSITNISPNIVGIKLSNTSNDILKVNLSKVDLDNGRQFIPDKIISSLLMTSEVRSEMVKTNTKFVLKLAGMISNPPPNSPHLQKNMKNVTVRNAFVDILKTFGGIIVYSECRLPSGQGRLNVDYYGTSF